MTEQIMGRLHHYFALVLIMIVASCLGTGCPKPAKVPAAQDVAAMTIATVALGVRVADEHCAARAKTIFLDGDKDAALELATKCAGNYNIARKSLLAAAYAVDGWSDADNRGKALCALTEATTALSLLVDAVKSAGAWSPPREVTMGLAAVSVLAEMVEAKACALPTPAASGGGK